MASNPHLSCIQFDTRFKNTTGCIYPLYCCEIAVFLRKDKNVEEYYNMLGENDKFQNIVTDRGTEAIPNLENYLAQRYIRIGRLEDAQIFIESLETKYANSLIVSKGPHHRIKWIPASQTAENLRMLIE
jgi:hypothetical protein